MNQTKRTGIIVSFCCMAALLAGCDEQEPAGPTGTSEMKEIGFGISSLHLRSNTLISKDSILSMGIFGYSTEYDVSDPVATSLQTATPNLLYNQKATRESIENTSLPGDYILSSWEYNPVVYWPMDLSVRNSFFAYSPHSSDIPSAIVSQNTSTGNPTITYTLPQEPTDMIDLLYSAPVLNKNRNSTEKVNDGKVVYDMKHALCWLSFVVAPEVYNGDEDEIYRVDWLSFMADNLPVTATLDLGTGSWSNATTDFRQYDFELTDEAENIKSGEVALVVDESSRLMLLPVTIDDTAGATIDITFWYKGIQYYYFAPFPTQRMTAGNIAVFVINISPDGATLTFQSEERIDNWIKKWQEGGSLDVDIY